MAEAHSSHGWCSLRLRFDQRELELLHGAEQVRGAAMARMSRPADLRTALSLAKAGQKVAHATPGTTVVLDETELGLLLDAVRYAVPEVQAAARPTGDNSALMGAFPELAEKGAWRSFGLTRELEALAARLASALKGG